LPPMASATKTFTMVLGIEFEFALLLENTVMPRVYLDGHKID